MLFKKPKNLGKRSVNRILLAEEQTTIISKYETIRIYKTLIKLRYVKINLREKSQIKSTQNLKKNDSEK